MSTTSRRTALRGSMAALLAGIAAPALAGATSPDAELIAACDEAVRQEGIKGAINRGEFGDDNEAAEDAASDAWWAAFERVEDFPATTIEGVRAKARVLQMAVRDSVCVGREYTVESHGALHERMADALCDEILAFGGVA